MWNTLLSWFWVYSVIEQLLKQTLGFVYFTELILSPFGNCPVIIIDNMCYLFYGDVFILF